MTETRSPFVPMILIVALQIILVLPAIVLGYTFLSPAVQIETLTYHYIFSGVLGLALGFISIVLISKKFNVRGKAVAYYGASGGLFGMLAVLYASWLISPRGAWLYETILTDTLNPGSPMNAWIGTFVYYMLFNTSFVYLYFKENEG